MTSEHPSEEIEAIGQLLLISSSDPKKKASLYGLLDYSTFLAEGKLRNSVLHLVQMFDYLYTRGK